MINNVDWSIKYNETNTNLPLLDRVLEKRQLNINDLNKTYNDMYDPFLMNDMDIAVMKIDEIRNKNKKILIFGDYDVDGTTSVKTIYGFFHDIGIECDYYIPDRIAEGYGITEEGLDYIIGNDYDLVITVDCGVTAISQIETLMSLGIEVIVTDHHECKETLPPAVAVIDCKRPDNTYPFKYLAGVGVALKFCQALSEEFGYGDLWKKYITYAALGTVADVVPLVDENRIIVKEGIEAIKKTDDLVIKNLLRIANKLDNIQKFTSTDISFYIAPRINASSRVGDVHIVMDLFLTQDPDKAFMIANELEILNTQRKETEAYIFAQANQYLLDNYDFKSPNAIIVYGDDWHKGVIGIVASKLVSYYNKPTIILSKDEDFYHGSCRTFGNIDIMSILNYASEYIEQYGGHEGAAGLTIHKDKLPLFIEKVNEFCKMNFVEENFRKIIEAEMVISTSDITLENAESLSLLEPFGAENKELLFICKDLRIRQMKKIGQKEGSENAHLKATFVDKNNILKTYDGIGFFMSDYFDVLPNDKNVDVLFSLSINEWKGNKNVQIMIKDIHFDTFFAEGTTIEESDLYHEDIITIEDIYENSGISEEELLPSKDDYIDTFKQLGILFKEPNNEIILTDLNLLTIILSTRLQRELNPFKVDRILETIEEAGYINYKKLLFDKIILSPALQSKPKCKMSQTNIYKKNHKIY